MEFSQFLAFTAFTAISSTVMGAVALPFGCHMASMAILVTLTGGFSVLVLTVRK